MWEFPLRSSWKGQCDYFTDSVSGAAILCAAAIG